EPVILRESSPSGDVAVVARNELEPASAVGDEQTEVRHHPVDAIEDDHFIDAVTVEIANHNLVVRLELPGARHAFDTAEAVPKTITVVTEELDRRAVMEQHVAAPAAEEETGMSATKVMVGLMVAGSFDRRVADWAILRRVAIHPAILDRPVNAGVQRPTAFK